MIKHIAILTLSIAIPFQMIQASPSDEALTSVKKLVGKVQKIKDKPNLADSAMGHVDVEGLAKELLGSYQKTATPEQIEKFKNQIDEYIRLRSFPLADEYIGTSNNEGPLIDIEYGNASQKGGRIHIPTVILYGGVERIRFTWVLHRVDDEYRVIDFLDGDKKSAIRGTRDGQVQPILKKEGIDGLLNRFDRILESYR